MPDGYRWQVLRSDRQRWSFSVQTTNFGPATIRQVPDFPLFRSAPYAQVCWLGEQPWFAHDPSQRKELGLPSTPGKTRCKNQTNHHRLVAQSGYQSLGYSYNRRGEELPQWISTLGVERLAFRFVVASAGLTSPAKFMWEERLLFGHPRHAGLGKPSQPDAR